MIEHQLRPSESATDDFAFRNLHPLVFIGTASDRYAGWVGQIYRQPYEIGERPKKLGGKTFKERTIETACVAEYFEHFGFVELDFTFYEPLLDAKLKPTRTHRTLSAYLRYLPSDGRVVLKVPQIVTARKIWREIGGERVFTLNESYLDARLFTERFHEPAVALLGERLAGVLLEHEYQRAKDCPSPAENISAHEKFFKAIPPDSRYHLEERTDRLKTKDYFACLRDHAVGNVFSHWTFLPPLSVQIEQAGGFTHPDSVMTRLLTPPGVRYEEAYAKYHPFDELKDEFPRMYADAAAIITEAIGQNRVNYSAVNNRAGGNAPRIAQRIKALLAPQGDSHPPVPGGE